MLLTIDSSISNQQTFSIYSPIDVHGLWNSLTTRRSPNLSPYPTKRLNNDDHHHHNQYNSDFNFNFLNHFLFWFLEPILLSFLYWFGLVRNTLFRGTSCRGGTSDQFPMLIFFWCKRDGETIVAGTAIEGYRSTLLQETLAINHLPSRNLKSVVVTDRERRNIVDSRGWSSDICLRVESVVTNGGGGDDVLSFQLIWKEKRERGKIVYDCNFFNIKWILNK